MENPNTESTMPRALWKDPVVGGSGCGGGGTGSVGCAIEEGLVVS